MTQALIRISTIELLKRDIELVHAEDSAARNCLLRISSSRGHRAVMKLLLLSLQRLERVREVK